MKNSDMLDRIMIRHEGQKGPYLKIPGMPRGFLREIFQRKKHNAAHDR